MTRKYDSTVARIAGNLLSGLGYLHAEQTATYVKNAVALAREIVAETQRTEPVTGVAVAPAADAVPWRSDPRCYNCKPTAPSPTDERYLCPRCATLYEFNVHGGMVKRAGR